MAHPLRIQRKRTAGWRMPEGAVYVGRPTVWGNPFETADKFRVLMQAVQMKQPRVPPGVNCSLADWVVLNDMAIRVRELRGKQLACWCPLDKPCHADVLAELANREVES